MEDILEDIIDRANRKLSSDEELRSRTQGLERTIKVSVRGGSDYYLLFKDSRVEVCEPEGDPDIVLEADEETYRSLVSGDLSPFKAYMTGKLRVRASMEDMMLAQSLTG